MDFFGKAKALERLTEDDEDRTKLNLTAIDDDEVQLISHALSQTTHLRMLELAVNQTSCEAIAALIPPIRGVTSLRNLHLYAKNRYNTDRDQAKANLNRLLESINPHVRTLMLEWVHVTAVAPFRTALASIQVLYLLSCSFDDNTSVAVHADFIHQIGQTLSGSRIRELDLHDLELRNKLPIVRAMANHPTLTKLALAHLCNESAMAVRDVLDSDQTKLERLQLNYSGLEKDNFSLIIQGLITNRTVRALIIRRSGITSDAKHLLPTLLKSNNTTMSHLEITDPDWEMTEEPDWENPESWDYGAPYNAILAASVRNTVLTTLLLEGFTFDTKILANFMARNRSVTHFSITHSIDLANFWKLQGGLQRRPISTKTLTRLDLTRSGLKDVHVPVLAQGLVQSAVAVLILANNFICDASALARCTTIQELDLTWNDIDDNGAVQLSTMAPRLERLNVNRCAIGIRGFRALLVAPFHTLRCKRLELLDDPPEEDHELGEALIELLPTASLRSLTVSVGSNRKVREIQCSKQQELQILQSYAKNKSLVAFDDDQTWFKTATSRRTVQHVLLRNAVRSHSTAIVPAAFAALLRQSSGVAVVYRMLCDHLDWITPDVLGPQRPHQVPLQDQPHSVAAVVPAVVAQRSAKRRRTNPSSA
jgi:hypothetical protein